MILVSVRNELPFFSSILGSGQPSNPISVAIGEVRMFVNEVFMKIIAISVSGQELGVECDTNLTAGSLSNKIISLMVALALLRNSLSDLLNAFDHLIQYPFLRLTSNLASFWKLILKCERDVDDNSYTNDTFMAADLIAGVRTLVDNSAVNFPNLSMKDMESLCDTLEQVKRKYVIESSHFPDGDTTGLQRILSSLVGILHRQFTRSLAGYPLQSRHLGFPVPLRLRLIAFLDELVSLHNPENMGSLSETLISQVIEMYLDAKDVLIPEVANQYAMLAAGVTRISNNPVNSVPPGYRVLVMVLLERFSSYSIVEMIDTQYGDCNVWALLCAMKAYMAQEMIAKWGNRG